MVQKIEELSIDLNTYNLLLLKIAGWFHDLGYLYAYNEHEERGMIIAANYLKNRLINRININHITACIEATKIDFKPRNRLEEIIKDADIGYGTTERFIQTSAFLRKEWETSLEKFYTDKE